MRAHCAGCLSRTEPVRTDVRQSHPRGPPCARHHPSARSLPAMDPVAYQEHAPPPELASAVQCIWELRGDGTGGPEQLIVPDGCAELVLNCADPFRNVAAQDAKQPLTMLVGEVRRPMRIRPN